MREQLKDQLLARSAWGSIAGALIETMPDRYREAIGRKAVENASYVSQLETINASRAARGIEPLSMSRFLAGSDEEQPHG